MNNFCTHFDSNYLVRGLALIHSLASVMPSVDMWVLCLDDKTYEFLSVPKNVPKNVSLHLIRLGEIEASDPELLIAKTNRSRVEYFFTLFPILPLFILKKPEAPSAIAYIDSDVFFYASPAPIFEELGSKSVAITPHRFSPKNKKLLRYGIFNPGFIIFRNDAPARNILEQWRSQCLEWCYDRVESGRFADQGYMNNWPKEFPDAVHIVANIGAHAAPWNLDAHTLTQSSHDRWVVENKALVFFHFQGIKRVSQDRYNLNLSEYGAPITKDVIALYSHYISVVNKHGGLAIGSFRAHDLHPIAIIRRTLRLIMGSYTKLP